MQTAYEGWKAGFNRTIEWRLTRAVKDRWYELIDELECYSEGSDEHEIIMDQIRSLPGHPKNTTREDLILQVVTDFQV
jgi:hypothetical protein